MENTVQVTVYTPEGFRVCVSIELKTANEIDELLKSNGYLPNMAGAKAGEDVEIISHVSLRMKANSDGTNTPHVAFYVENEGYEFRWVHKYLNNDSDVQEFEASTGVILATMPVFPATSHPERKPDKMQYIVKLAKNIKVARKQVDKGLNADGTPNKRNYFERYVTTAGQSESSGDSKAAMTKEQWRDKIMESSAYLFSGLEAQKTVLNRLLNDNKISYSTHDAKQALEVIAKSLDEIPF